MGITERLRGSTQSHAVLVKNSGAIIIGSVTAAILGFGYWWLAARWLPPEVIGTASGLISLMAFIGLLGEYIGEIFIATKNRPAFLIYDRFGFDD